MNEHSSDTDKLIRENEELRRQLAAFRDQTDERAAPEALRESEERYRFLFENMLNGFAYCKVRFEQGRAVDITYLMVNERFQALTGLRNVAGKNASEVVPGLKESDPGLLEIYARVALTGVPEQFERYVARLETWFSIAVHSPKKEHFVVVFDAITERKRAEEALRASEAKYRALFDKSTDGILMVDIETKAFRYANPAVSQMLGYSESELCAMHVPDIHPKDSLSHVLAEFEAASRGERTLAVDIPCLKKDGTIVYADITAAILTIDGRALTAGFFRDSTARKRAEFEHRRLTTAIEQAAEVVVITDVQGAIVYVNPAFEAVTGYTRAQVLGRNPRLLKSGVQEDEFYRVLWATISGGKTWRGRLVNKKKDGTHFTEEVTISPVRDGAGVITSYVAVKRDITRELTLETQFLQAQKMEGIGRLAGGIAHDFNNLLAVILTYTGILVEDAREGDPMKEDLLEVKKAADRAVALTRQLLAFSRKQVLQPEVLNLNQIAAGVEKMLRRILGEDIELVQVLAPNLGLTLADPGQIEQVLMNLVVNARDAMLDGGKLTIETSNAEIDEECAAHHVDAKAGAYVLLAVTDTGCGMDERTKSRIFEPFFTTKEKGKGTGLGLSTVYGIVKQSGGNVWVYSELGQGTTFKIFLPREGAATTVTSVRPSMVPRRSTGTETVLLVEDEQALRKVARRTLEAAGYRVLTAAEGEEARQICAQHPGEIHLLLTDVVMPGMNGRALAQELSKTRPALKVLYMSGYADDAIVHRGVLDAGTHFLSKPFTATALTRKIREVLDQDILNWVVEQRQASRSDTESKEGLFDKQAPRALPQDLLCKLREAVMATRYDEVGELIESIRSTRPDVADLLQRMANLSDYAGMRDFLRE